MPGLNGQGLSVARLDILGGGVVPLHTHPNAAEMIIVVKGTMTAGFITQTSLATSTVYMKTLKEGDVMVFPQGLTHFKFNLGKEVSTAYASYSSSKPDLQLSTVVSFGNNLPPAVVSKVTYITISEVLRLKVLFGGTLT
ncbi:hypothetical protein RJT34_12093 [Clitoria ternatea]|uniref:Germin-like protein n=1 Tax=Clitoria ternatea TaxID=43366 RepID=A0AAN9PL23_CLITE